MGRERTVAKKKKGLLEDLFAIATTFPWWVGCILAVVAYGVLHRYATAEVATSAVPGQVGQLVISTFTQTLASVGQYVIPIPLLAGAAASYLGRRKRAGLVSSVAGDKSGAALRNMSWRDFELLVGSAFRMRGFTVTETGGGGADGGIDLKLVKDNEVFLVQCKQWRAYKVSVNIVRELLGVMAAQGAAGGFVVTSGVFTAEAREFAKGLNIELMDGEALSEMIDKARATGLTSQTALASAFEPACPLCRSAMVKRTARQGANAGNVFWGCSTFPKCRGLRAIE
jgi:restriction system protein